MAETIFDREALLELPKSKLFKGKWFHIHGPMTGFTEGKLTRLIEKHGGKVSDKVIGNANVSHVVLSGQYCKSYQFYFREESEKLTIPENRG